MQKLKSFLRNKKEIVICNAFLLAITVLIAFFSKIALFIFCSALFVICLSYTVYYYIVKYRYFPDDVEGTSEKATIGILMNFAQPVLMIGSDDTVRWYNNAFSSLKEVSEVKKNQSVKGFLSGALTYSVVKNKGGSFTIRFEDKLFNINTLDFVSGGRNYILFIWSDATAQYEAENTLKMKNVVVGYVAVDNASDVASYLQDQHRSMVAKAYAELHTWVQSMNGIIREYDRDKYIIFVDEENFVPNIAKKFDVLDRIDTAVSGDSVRLTLSMGFVIMNGTLAEKEAGAREALEYAFQRGGAQIVVKSRDGNRTFGGQSRASAKTTKIKSRVNADKLKALIVESDNVIVMGHKNIDVDAIASACAVARLAMFLDKKVNIVINVNDAALDSTLSFLDGLDEYDNVFVDHVRGQELLSPKSLVVIVDASNPKIFESCDIYSNAQNVAIIDHHVQTNEFDSVPALQYIDPTASSASELMCEMLEQVIPRSALKSSEAELLLAGILLDTQRFTRNTGVRTFGATMYLRTDNKMMLKARSLFKSSIGEYVKLSTFRKNAVIFRDVIGISHFEDDNLPENRIIASMAADDLLEINGVQASFAMCTIGDDVHISGRSNGGVNVAKILEQLNGGGRFEAAATVLKSTSINDAGEQLKEAIDNYWRDKYTTGGNL